MLAEGVATLPELREGELGWTIVAALRASEVAVPPGLADEIDGEDASIAERAKILKKELSRKAKAVVQQLAQQRGRRARSTSRASGARRSRVGQPRRPRCGRATSRVALAQLDVGRGGKALTDSRGGARAHRVVGVRRAPAPARDRSASP